MKAYAGRGMGAVAAMILIGQMFLPTSAFAGRSDHGLFFTGSTPADTAIFCGVKLVPALKAYTLHVSATASGSGGTFRINFRDGDSMGFEVPAGSTYSTTHALGGVPEVDDIVKITAEGGVQSMMASVLAEPGAVDPFDETLDGRAADDNFCVTAPSEPGSTSAVLVFPAP